MSKYDIAQLNIATLLAPIDSPQLSDFVANMDRINALAEESPGFVWRFQTKDGDATGIDYFCSGKTVNLSLWDSIEALHNYVYRSAHVEIIRRKKEWFHKMGEAYMVLWWVPTGHIPSIEEAAQKLSILRYWAQPAVEALLSLADQLLSPASVTSIVVETFHEARCLHVVSPATTEQAQYSLPWALAAALTRGTISVDSVTTDLANVEIHQLAARVVLTENDEFNQKFPAERWARVSLHLANGQILVSDDCQAKGHLQNPLSDRELKDKYQGLAEPVLGTRAQDIQLVVETLDTRPASDLLVLLGALN
jgi:hypothetical protein